MTKKCFALFALSLTFLCMRMLAQESEANIRVTVDMVQLNVAVTDDKGNYITGLGPSDFSIVEDSIPQKLATFGEGNEPVRRVSDGASVDGKPGQGRIAQKVFNDNGPQTLGSMVAGANVYLLFDTSNY